MFKKWQANVLWMLVAMTLVLVADGYWQHAADNDAVARTGVAKATSQEQRRRELEQATHKLLDIVEKGNSKELPLLCSARGVVFGIDAPPVPLATIRRQIEGKTGVYCRFFDTECLQRENAAERAKSGAPPRAEPLYSYRDRLLKAPARQLKASFSGRLGNVTVTLTGDVQAQEPIEFEFIYEGGQWKLSAVPFY